MDCKYNEKFKIGTFFLFESLKNIIIHVNVATLILSNSLCMSGYIIHAGQIVVFISMIQNYIMFLRQIEKTLNFNIFPIFVTKMYQI